MLTYKEFMDALKKENAKNTPAYVAYLQGYIDGLEDSTDTLKEKSNHCLSLAENYIEDFKKEKGEENEKN